MCVTFWRRAYEYLLFRFKAIVVLVACILFVSLLFTIGFVPLRLVFSWFRVSFCFVSVRCRFCSGSASDRLTLRAAHMPICCLMRYVPFRSVVAYRL